MPALRLYLASASPRRRELLVQVGLRPEVVPVHVDEARKPGESARAMALRLAEVKARRAVERIAPGPETAVVLGADTAVVIDDRVLGKPADSVEAAAMLRALRGRNHEVLTGVFLLRVDDGGTAGGVELTRVRFRDFDDAMLRAYAAADEPLDKAGAYGIQGRGALLAEGIEGSWSNVVGLPIERLPAWFARLGIDLGELIDWGG